MLGSMSDFVTGLLDLWSDDHGSRAAAEAAFREWYADPVLVNGAPLSIAAMVDRAEEVRATYPDAPREVLDVLETPGKVAVASGSARTASSTSSR
jgi:hypothetical protein